MVEEDSNGSSSRRHAGSQQLSIPWHMSLFMSQPQQVEFATRKITISNEDSAKLWIDLREAKRDCSISQWMSSEPSGLEECKEMPLEAQKHHNSCDKRPAYKAAPIRGKGRSLGNKHQALCFPDSVFYSPKLPVISVTSPYHEIHDAKTNSGGWRVENFNMIPGKAHISIINANKIEILCISLNIETFLKKELRTLANKN